MRRRPLDHRRRIGSVAGGALRCQEPAEARDVAVMLNERLAEKVPALGVGDEV